jgi:hypothetical protein
MRAGQGLDQRRFSMVDMAGSADDNISQRHDRIFELMLQKS